MLPIISVLGVSGYHKTDTLKSRVEDALRDLNVDVQVAEVTDLEEMVASRIAAIPALIVNNHVLVQGEIPDLNSLKELLRKYVYRRIIVPVDFSESSLAALRYAEKIAEAFSMSIKVLHVYGPIPTVPEGPVMESASEWLDTLHEDMKTFIEPAPNPDTRRMMAHGAKIDYEIRAGNIEAELRRESRQPDNRLIVMANSSDHDIGNRWFGSTAAQVARQAECPVLLVPGELSFSGFRRVTVATDADSLEKAHLAFIKTLLQPFDGKASYVHVDTESRLYPGEDLNDLLNGSGPVIHEQAKRVEDGLLEYSRRNNSDIVVLISRRRRAWQELFHRSCTKHLAEKCPLPLLVLPPGREV